MSQTATAMPSNIPPPVAAVYDAYPAECRDGLLSLRALILSTAAETPGVGRVEEALRWGQPAYLTPQTKSGSTLRIGLPKSGGFALYVHCQTRLLPESIAQFPDAYRYEGSRAVLFDVGDTPAPDPLRLLIARALTYHLSP